MAGGDILGEGDGGDIIGTGNSVAATTGVFHIAGFGGIGDGTADDVVALKAALAAAVEVAKLGGRGIVELDGRKTYLLKSGSGVTLPNNLLGLVLFRGNGATIKLSEGCRRLFDMVRAGETKHDVVQNFTAEEFTLDCANVVHAGVSEHRLFGNVLQGAIQKYLSVKNIHLRRIRYKNVFSPAAAESEGAVSVVKCRIKQDGKHSEEATQDYAKDIFIEDVKQEGANGGLFGFDITGESSAAETFPNVLIDNIVCRDIVHQVSAAPIAVGTMTSGNLQIGGRAYGGRCLIENCWGNMSQDVGIEINAMTYATVRDCVIKDARNSCYLRRSFGEALEPSAMMTLYRGCKAERHLRATTKGYRTLTPGVAAEGSTGGPVYFEGCDFYSDIVTPSTGLGDAWSIEDTNPLVSWTDCRGVIDKVEYSTAVTAVTPAMVKISSAAPLMVLHSRNFSLRYAGKRTESAGAFKVNFLRIGETVIEFDMDLRISNGVEGSTTGSNYVLLNESGTETKLRGEIRVAVDATGDDSAPRGIYAGAKTLVDGELRLRADYMSVGTQVQFDAGLAEASKAAIKVSRITPAAAAAVTVNASPSVYRNLDGYAQRVIVRGGTVSKIEISNDGSTYEETGATAGAFVLDHGDSIRVTYSVAPTMRKVPLR